MAEAVLSMKAKKPVTAVAVDQDTVGTNVKVTNIIIANLFIALLEKLQALEIIYVGWIKINGLRKAC